jgi:hypothetical protein
VLVLKIVGSIAVLALALVPLMILVALWAFVIWVNW